MNPSAPVEKVAGGGQPTAAVVAAPSKDNDWPVLQGVFFVFCGQNVFGQEGEVSTCVFHHLRQLKAETFDHQPVHLLHLVNGERWQDHGCWLGILGGTSRKLRSQQTNVGITMVLVHM